MKQVPRSWNCLRYNSKFVYWLKLLILKTQRILIFSLNCLPSISFTWNFSYPFMVNKEFMSNLTSEFKSKIFYDPGARWLSFLSDKKTRKDEGVSDLHEIVLVGQHTLVNMVKEWSWDKKKNPTWSHPMHLLYKKGGVGEGIQTLGSKIRNSKHLIYSY